MNKLRFFSAVFCLLGILAATAGIYLALNNTDASPVLVRQPEAAKKQVVTMLDALSNQDYDTVTAALYGEPALGLNRDPGDEVGQLLWEAYAGSVTYELVGQFHATDSGVAQNVVVTAMDVKSVTENLRTRSQTLLEERVAAAEDTSEIYGENNEYKEEFVMAVLHDAAQEALENDAKTKTWEITLNLTYENGQWWIMPEKLLMEAISGGILN